VYRLQSEEVSSTILPVDTGFLLARANTLVVCWLSVDALVVCINTLNILVVCWQQLLPYE